MGQFFNECLCFCVGVGVCVGMCIGLDGCMCVFVCLPTNSAYQGLSVW